MAKPSALSGLGVPGVQAVEICGTVSNLLTATGVAQTDALQCPSSVNVFTTVASGTGAQLQPVEVSAGVAVANLGANALLLYPATGQSINLGAANAALSIAAGKVVELIGVSGTQWIAISGA